MNITRTIIKNWNIYWHVHVVEESQKNVSDDEISFYFVLGMSLARFFNEEKKDGEDEE